MAIPIEKIIDAAEKSGFDSELRVAAALSSAGWTVRQSVYYIDRDEGKGRELDAYAYKIFAHITDEPEVSCHLNFCVEVKKTAQPFIFFSSKPQRHEAPGGYGLLNWHQSVDRHVLSYEEIEDHRPNSRPERFSRSFCSLKDGKAQQVQSGVLSALKAAIHYREECDEGYSDSSRDICFFIPMLVVDGELYDCHFPEGSSELQADSVSLVMHIQNYLSERYGRVSIPVTVVTLSELPSLLSNYTQWGSSVLTTMVKKRHLYKDDL